MKRWRPRLFLALAIGATAAIASGVTLAIAKTPPPPITFTPIALGKISPLNENVPLKGGLNFKVTIAGTDTIIGFRKLIIQPGGVEPWHRHSGSAFGVITQGTVTEYRPDFPHCGPKTATGPGAAFFERGDIVHTIMNRGNIPVVLYVLSFDSPKFIKAPLLFRKRPKGCPPVP
jgi:quercetin dioxygenase-like cupin family protein